MTEFYYVNVWPRQIDFERNMNPPETGDLPPLLEMYDQLPRDFTEEYIVDHLYESYDNGRSYLQQLLYVWETGGDLSAVMTDLIQAAVDNQRCIEQWEYLNGD